METVSKSPLQTLSALRLTDFYLLHELLANSSQNCGFISFSNFYLQLTQNSSTFRLLEQVFA